MNRLGENGTTSQHSKIGIIIEYMYFYLILRLVFVKAIICSITALQIKYSMILKFDLNMATRYLVRIPFKSIFHSQRITLNKIYANIKYLSEKCNYTEVEIY